jgi:hypothetical protein
MELSMKSNTTGLTNHNEIYVINSTKNYNTFIQKPGPNRYVEYPRYPSLVTGEPGIVQEGICKQEAVPKTNQTCKTQSNQNHMELIRDRYEKVQNLIGYMRINSVDYNLFKVNTVDTKTGITFINCGSQIAEYVNETVYAADTGIGGDVVSTDEPILSARNYTPIYQTARTTNSSWIIPVPINGIYEVRVRMAAIDGATDMDIIINDRLRREGLDIVSTVDGEFKRYDIPFRVPVISETISLSITGNGLINGIDISKLYKEEYEFQELSKEEKVENRGIYLFVNKNLMPMGMLNRKIIDKLAEMRRSIIPSKGKFDFY